MIAPVSAAPIRTQTLPLFNNASSASGGGGLSVHNLGKIGAYAFGGAVIGAFLPVIPGGPIGGAVIGALLAMFL